MNTPPLARRRRPSRDTPIFGCASFYPGTGHPNRPMPAADELPPHTPGLDVFERQVLSVKALLDKGLIKYWGLSNGARAPCGVSRTGA